MAGRTKPGGGPGAGHVGHMEAQGGRSGGQNAMDRVHLRRGRTGGVPSLEGRRGGHIPEPLRGLRMDREGEAGVGDGPQELGQAPRRRGLRDPGRGAQVELEGPRDAAERADRSFGPGDGVDEDVHRRSVGDPLELPLDPFRGVDRGVRVRHLADEPDPSEGRLQGGRPKVLDPLLPRLPLELPLDPFRGVDRGVRVRHLADEPDPSEGRLQGGGPKVLDPLLPRLPGVDVEVGGARDQYGVTEVQATLAVQVPTEANDRAAAVDPDLGRLEPAPEVRPTGHHELGDRGRARSGLLRSAPSAGHRRPERASGIRTSGRHRYPPAALPGVVSPRPARSGWTYAQAGVDRGEVSEALSALLAGVRYRPPASSGRRLDLPGHYAGIVRIGRESIAVTTDTVGTKVLLAEQLGEWEGIGEDAVAVNVNDLAAVGARPFGLVDCISCDHPRPAAFAAIGRGLDRGLRAAKCALLGGETAVVPDIVTGVDVGGTALGFFPGRRRPVTGDRIRPGDVVLGLGASGFHANGFTLVRRLLTKAGPDLAQRVPGERRPLGRALLAPTRIHVGASEAVADDPGVHGLAHISGGGVRNLFRLHPRVRFVLDAWPAPSGLFRWAQEVGHIAPSELYQTFNVGIGFVVVARRAAVPEVTARLRRAGFPDARPVGRVEPGVGVSVPAQGLEFSGYA